MGDVKKCRIGGKGRNGGGLDHLDVGHVDILGDNEGRGAHDGRCQLTVRTGGHLNGGRFGGGVADLFHQGDGEGPGGDDVGNARAIYQTGESAAHHRRLGRPSLKPAQNAQGQLNKILTGTRFIQHGTEEYK